jgi:predicted GNAT family acetyltransferase
MTHPLHPPKAGHDDTFHPAAQEASQGLASGLSSGDFQGFPRGLFPHVRLPSFTLAPVPSSSITQQDRCAQWMDDALAATDPAQVPMQDLRTMINHMYRLLDTDHPPLHAKERYEAFAAELTQRANDLALRHPGTGAGAGRMVFTDCRFFSRFELYVDGVLAVFVNYTMSTGHLHLIELVVKPAFEGRGLDQVVMRRILFDAHKRRLSITPDCAPATKFLQENPQYAVLARRHPNNAS